MSWMPTLIVAGALTFAIRLSFIGLLGHARMPPLVARALRLVPTAVLSAIILPEMVLRDGSPDLSPRNPRLVAGVVAAGVALLGRNVLLTIAAGMGTLWALQAMGR